MSRPRRPRSPASRRGTLGVGVAALLTLAACERSTPPAPSCESLGVEIAAAGPAERRVLGRGAPYEADPMLAARTDELRTSQRARREAAWQAVARVLAPVTTHEVTPVADATVPTFRTWYDRDDLHRLFQHAFSEIGRERRRARAPFDDDEIEEALLWNEHAVDEITGWTPTRFAEYVASIHDPRALGGLAGIRRVAVSPDAMRHMLASYDEIARCLETAAALPAFVDGPPGSAELARVSLRLPRCHERTEGPYFVASGATLSARWSAASEGAEDAVVTVRASTDGVAAATLCEGDGLTGCAVTGPSAFFVTTRAGSRDVRGTLEVDVTSAAMTIPACLRGRFPLGAASVAAHWQRADLGLPLATFDTSAAALRRRFDSGDATWGEGDGHADPGPDAIYTMTLPDGPSFRLAGLHIRTRELEHWLNVTLWWSPEPNTDFGADRPEGLGALSGPWSHYKMCVSIDFEEHDPDPRGGFEGGERADLGEALAEVHDRASWCSNPYIDAAPGLLRSNCVGCHQHALSGAQPADVALDANRFPDGGRTRTRNNEPGDGFWSFDAGDDFGPVLRDALQWWQAAEASETQAETP